MQADSSSLNQKTNCVIESQKTQTIFDIISEKIPHCDFEILGTITSKGEADFNVGEYVESTEWYFPKRHIVFMNYMQPLVKPNLIGQWRQELGVSFRSARESFLSLLTFNGLSIGDNKKCLIVKKVK
ncbi:MAG: hypothetical protein QM791_04225 [Ferruginibacter sp.]